jgi:hypothetical protein
LAPSSPGGILERSCAAGESSLAHDLHRPCNGICPNLRRYTVSIFGSILAKIFPSSHPAVVAAATSNAPAEATAPTPEVAAAPPVDVEAVLTALQANNSQQLNWQTSIVDLMKLLGLDSSLEARKTLAGELKYSGSTEDSAAMNIWLHKAVMEKLAANGGKVPDDLK